MFSVSQCGMDAERWNSATPGRGLKPTREFPANPKRFPALAAVIWFGNPSSITQKISGKNLQTRNDGWRCHCTGNCNRERGERHEKKSALIRATNLRIHRRQRRQRRPKVPLPSLSFLLFKTSEHYRLCPPNEVSDGDEPPRTSQLTLS